MLRTGVRLSTSNSNRSRIDYLNQWIGSSSPKTSTSGTSPQQQQQQHPPSTNASMITVSGGTFLIPTVRIQRGATPEKISSDLMLATNQSPSARALLAGRKNGVPLVVDLASFCPDGSPHFKPLAEAELNQILTSMRSNGLIPIAITNSGSSDSLDQIAAHSGLPTVMRGVGRGGDTQGISVSDLLRVVTVKQGDRSLFIPEKSREEDEEIPSNNHVTVAAPEVAAPRVERVEIQIETPKPPLPTPTSPSPPPEIIYKEVPTSTSTKIYYGSIRSGQQVTSDPGGSLVVLGSVNSGGEAIADGDIHVYGKLKGRALAGLGEGGSGGGSAKESGRIYAGVFDPELVCIAGVFTTIDNVVLDEMGLKKGKGGMCWLDAKSGKLKFEKLDLN